VASRRAALTAGEATTSCDFGVLCGRNIFAMDPDDLRTLKDLLRQQRLLSLGVVADGLPVVGLLPFLAAPNLGALVVHASRLAPHTAGLGDNQPWSGIIAEPDAFERDPLQTPRVLLRGLSRAIEDPQVLTRIRSVWRDRYPSAAMTLDLGDFTFFSLDLAGGRLIAGFARALNLSREHFDEAAALPN
jgi:heme iron utilization protein